MTVNCHDHQDFCFTDLPLHSVLTEWLGKNVPIPCNTATWLTQIGLFLLTWYAVKFTLRMFMTLVWPVMIILCGYMALHMLRMSGNEFPEIFLFYVDEFYYWATSTGLRLLDYIYYTVGPGPLLYPPPF